MGLVFYHDASHPLVPPPVPTTASVATNTSPRPPPNEAAMDEEIKGCYGRRIPPFGKLDASLLTEMEEFYPFPGAFSPGDCPFRIGAGISMFFEDHPVRILSWLLIVRVWYWILVQNRAAGLLVL
jgi:hypothetical protein